MCQFKFHCTVLPLVINAVPMVVENSTTGRASAQIVLVFFKRAIAARTSSKWGNETSFHRFSIRISSSPTPGVSLSPPFKRPEKCFFEEFSILRVSVTISPLCILSEFASLLKLSGSHRIFPWNFRASHLFTRLSISSFLRFVLSANAFYFFLELSADFRRQTILVFADGRSLIHRGAYASSLRLDSNPSRY